MNEIEEHHFLTNTYKRNINFNDLKNDFIGFFNKYKDVYSKICWSMVINKSDLIIEISEIYPTIENNNTYEEIYWEYNDWILVRKSFEVQDFITFLNGIEVDGEIGKQFLKINMVLPMQEVSSAFQIEIESFHLEFHPLTYHWQFIDDDRKWSYYEIKSKSKSNVKLT